MRKKKIAENSTSEHPANFGDITRLVTNVQKSYVASIRRSNIDLDDILSAFQAYGRPIFNVVHGPSFLGASFVKCRFPTPSGQDCGQGYVWKKQVHHEGGDKYMSQILWYPKEQ